MTGLLIARLRPGVVGESKRTVHLFAIPTGEFDTLTAYCGATFGPGQLELLERVCGMPCEKCMLRAPQPGELTS